MTRGTMSLG